jgi:hypothetical protein
MTDEEYLRTQNSIVFLAYLVDDLDLKGFVDLASKAEILGSVIDPTLFLKAGFRLQQLRGLAEALLPFQQAIRHAQQAEAFKKAGKAAEAVQGP